MVNREGNQHVAVVSAGKAEERSEFPIEKGHTPSAIHRQKEPCALRGVLLLRIGNDEPTQMRGKRIS
jgi:hypothetical protein